MKTLDEMRMRHLLTADQHASISSWVAGSGSAEAIMDMARRAVESAHAGQRSMNVDGDLTQPPLMAA